MAHLWAPAFKCVHLLMCTCGWTNSFPAGQVQRVYTSSAPSLSHPNLDQETRFTHLFIYLLIVNKLQLRCLLYTPPRLSKVVNECEEERASEKVGQWSATIASNTAVISMTTPHTPILDDIGWSPASRLWCGKGFKPPWPTGEQVVIGCNYGLLGCQLQNRTRHVL